MKVEILGKKLKEKCAHKTFACFTPSLVLEHELHSNLAETVRQIAKYTLLSALLILQ